MSAKEVSRARVKFKRYDVIVTIAKPVIRKFVFNIRAQPDNKFEYYLMGDVDDWFPCEDIDPYYELLNTFEESAGQERGSMLGGRRKSRRKNTKRKKTRRNKRKKSYTPFLISNAHYK